MGWRPGLQEEIQDAKEPAAGDWEPQEACLKVLLAEDRSLPLRTIPQLDEESAHCPVLVTLIPESDPEPPLQGVPRVESPAEGPVGRDAEGERGETTAHDQGPPRRRKAQPGGIGFPLHHGCGEAEEGAGWELSEWERREREEGRILEAEELVSRWSWLRVKGRCSYTPSFMASAEED